MNSEQTLEMSLSESFLEGQSDRPKSGYRPAGTGALQGPVDFQKMFGNDHPVELEIGCGKGKFLFERAAANPNINFVGLDWSRKWLEKGVIFSTKNSLQNIRFFWIRAGEFLNQVSPGNLAVLHIYFPDPWPKRRHEARRLIQTEFLEHVWTLLESQGKVEIATDYVDYFRWMKRVVQESTVCWSGLRLSKNERIFSRKHQTHYEMKFTGEGRDRFYMELQK